MESFALDQDIDIFELDKAHAGNLQNVFEEDWEIEKETIEYYAHRPDTIIVAVSKKNAPTELLGAAFIHKYCETSSRVWFCIDTFRVKKYWRGTGLATTLADTVMTLCYSFETDNKKVEITAQIDESNTDTEHFMENIIKIAAKLDPKKPIPWEGGEITSEDGSKIKKETWHNYRFC